MSEKVGRPTVMTPETIAKLESAYLLGCTDVEACFAADVGQTTLYRYCEENPEFRERKERLKANPVFLARGIVTEALQAKDKAMALEVLKSKQGMKLALTGEDGGPVQISSVVRKIVRADD